MGVTNAAHATKLLSTIKTWTVKTSGGDFTTLADAIAYFADKWLGVLQTIQMDDGVWTINSTVLIDHPQGYNVKITGTNTYAKTISSIQANTITGNNSNTSKVLTNLSTTANLIVGIGVTGTGVATNSEIVSIDSGTQVTLNLPCTSSNTGITFTIVNKINSHIQQGNTTNGSKVVTNLGNTSIFQVGNTVSGTGVASTIASIDSATQITLAANASATNTGVSLTFTTILGTHLYILNVNSIANTTTSDMVSIYGMSGGTNPTYIVGCHKIVNVDAGNTRITIRTGHIAATSASGAVSGSLYVIKTVIRDTQNADVGCLELRSKLNQLDKLVIIDATLGRGIYISRFGGIMNQATANQLGFCNCNAGILFDRMAQGSYFWYTGIGDCTTGVSCQTNSYSEWAFANICGCQTGLTSQYGALAFPFLATVTGCGTGTSASGSSFNLTSSMTNTGNTTDFSPAINTLGNNNAYNQG